MPIAFKFDSYDEISNFLKKEKEMLFYESFEVISECLKTGDDLAIVANLKHPSGIFVVKVDRPNWKQHLLISLEYFEHIENYEFCLKIKQLLNTIEELN